MLKIVFHPAAAKEFRKISGKNKKLVAEKIFELKKGMFSGDKSLKGKHRGKFRKRAGRYRIIYLKEEDILLITIVRIAHRKEVY